MTFEKEEPAFVTGEFEYQAAPTIPPGSYTARLAGVSELDGQWGKRLRWHWEIPDIGPDGGPFKVSTFSGTRLAPSSNFLKYATALRDGVAPSKGETVRLETLTGRHARLEIVLDAEGMNQVDGVLAADKPTAAPAADPDREAFERWKATQAADPASRSSASLSSSSSPRSGTCSTASSGRSAAASRTSSLPVTKSAIRDARNSRRRLTSPCATAMAASASAVSRSTRATIASCSATGGTATTMSKRSLRSTPGTADLPA